MISNIMNSMIPVSRFNKGEAGKIFKEVQKSGTKIVVKNNKPECVLVSPMEYEKIIETVEDYLLYMQAADRMKKERSTTFLSESDVIRELGISDDDIDKCEVELD